MVLRRCTRTAQRDWRRHLSPPPAAEGTLFLADDLDPFEHDEQRLDRERIKILQDNILELLEARGEFVLGEHMAEVFKDIEGLVTEPLVRAAVKDLYKRNVTGCDGKHKPQNYVITHPR